MRPPALLLALLTGNVALLVSYILVPRWRGPLFREDGAVETASALLFLASFVAGVAVLTRCGPDRYRALLVLGSGLGLIGFLDEISFGARLFGWSMPVMSGGGDFDGAHDVVVLAYRLGSEAGPAALGATALVVAALAGWGVARWHRTLASLPRRVAAEPPYAMFALFVGLLGVAVIVDLRVGYLRRLGLVEETLELNAAASLLLSMLLTVRPMHPRA